MEDSTTILTPHEPGFPPTGPTELTRVEGLSARARKKVKRDSRSSCVSGDPTNGAIQQDAETQDVRLLWERDLLRLMEDRGYV